MPHKRAKRSVRDRQKSDQGEDLAPTKYSLVDEPIPKSLARVLNATKIREEWKGRKRKLEEVGGNAHAGKRRKAGDDAERSTEKKQKSKLAIKPGESIQHFNRRVEDDMRPLVKAAVQSSNTVVRNVRKAQIAAPAKEARNLGKGHKTRAGEDEDPRPALKPPNPERDKPLKEFQRHSSSAPRRLNDIVQAPPDLKKLPRGVKASSEGGYKAGGKREGVLSMAQKQMMEAEREKAIARYRELKASRHQNGEGGDERDRSGVDD